MRTNSDRPLNTNRTYRILYVVPRSASRVGMIFAHNEIARIAEAGHETKTFMFATSLNPTRISRETVRLKRITRLFQPDLIHAHFGTLTGFVSGIVSQVTGVPLVVTFRGSDLNPAPSCGRLRNVCQKVLSHLAAFRSTINICVSCQLREKLWWCRWKTTVIPTGIDLDFFKPERKEKARRILGWSKDERIVLFNCGLSPGVKRFDIAAKSVRVMRKRIGDVRLVILRGDVEHNQVPLYLSGADCLLLTSDYEGSPDIIKEALACDLPIVSVDVGDVVERLKGVYPSRIVPRDPRVIGAAAAEIVLLGRRSNGREVIRELSATAIRDKILQVYNCALGGGRYGS